MPRFFQEHRLRRLIFNWLLAAALALSSSTTPAVAAVNYQGLWFNPNESGWGVNFAHQGDLIFASWFTYDLSGKGTWLVTTLSKTTGTTYTGQLFQGSGPAYDAVPFPPLGSPGGAVIGGLGGTAAVTFIDADNATFTYTVAGITQTKTITRQLFGPQPVCTFGAQTDLTLATNYTDLWWASPGGSEAGWGVNLTHQGDTLFASWFTYDHDHTPMWLVATASKALAKVYNASQLFKLSGPGFNAVPFPPLGAAGGPTGASVGTATFAFSSGNAGNFTYTINGVTQTKAITREIFTPPGTVCQEVQAASAVKGLWVGKTSVNEAVLALITQDGTYYMLYSMPGTTGDAGVLQGSSTSVNGKFASQGGMTFQIANLAETGASGYDTAVNGDYVPQSSLQLTVSSSLGTRTLAATYVAGSETPPSLADVAGSYVGKTGHAGGEVRATFTVDTSGNIVATNVYCTIHGTISPLPSLNAFTFTVQPNANCIFGTDPTPGVLYYDVAMHRLHGFLQFSDRADQFYLIGDKN